MPIPRQKIPVKLIEAKPTAITVENVKKQLDDIGLNCALAAEENLEAYIREVESRLPVGGTETYQILKPTKDPSLRVAGLYGDYEQSSIGNWEPDSVALGYSRQLEYIQYDTHFDWLLGNQPGFTGVVNNPPAYKGRYGSVDAIKEMFINVSVNASATLVKGLNKASMESVLSNAIAPLTDKNAQDYNPGPQSRVIFLVENYDPGSGNADAVGVLTLWWDLKIVDYKEKKKSPQHDTTLTVRTRSVLYSSVEAMDSDYLAARTHFKENSFLAIPPKPTKVQIFTARPPATEDTFLKSLPKIATQDRLQAIVLFAPNVQLVGSIDNSNSDVTTTYEKSVTTGFTFSMAQQLSVEANFEAGVVIAKGGVKIGLSFTFTEEWSKSSTESMSFSVPPGKMAFTYQGYLQAQILEYDASKDTYSYKESARVLSNVLATSRTPLVDPV
jgi:hypothetical protein